MSFPLLCFVGILFGAVLGFFVQRSGLCFSAGLGEIFVGRGKRIVTFFLVIFIITSLGFMASRFVNPKLGLKTIGQIRGYGFFNVLSGMIFGAGIYLSGGCILGTLRQIGEGNMLFIVTLLSFIPGMALIVYGIDPVLAKGYHIQKVLLTNVVGVEDYIAVYVLVLFALLGLRVLGIDKKTK